MIAAASGMKARLESLDMLANNLANTGTAGFKADREFYNLYEQQLPLIENRWTDFSQGSVIPTGNPLDLALSGPGFFALNGLNGIVYTRNGSFRVSKNNQLESVEGYTLRNILGPDPGKPITIDPSKPVLIDKTGTVKQDGETLGKLEIDRIPNAAGNTGNISVTGAAEVAPANPAQPSIAQQTAAQQNTASSVKLGNSYFMLNINTAAPVPEEQTEVLQGQLEQSNVPLSDSAVRLMSVMRQFEMLQKALSVGTQMNKEAIQDVARPS